MVREFSDRGNPGPRGENKVLYDDFVDMLVVGSPRFGVCYNVFLVPMIY